MCSNIRRPKTLKRTCLKLPENFEDNGVRTPIANLFQDANIFVFNLEQRLIHSQLGKFLRAFFDLRRQKYVNGIAVRNSQIKDAA